ncbi:MAG: cyclopropane-fatty-acyl-phospholipid synthase family protein [Gammaproteobacteria bacterium]|nr:cyclopropane-fatty-acyl-phospholipid synthase family protein [Gammaproteobacteria bacterium]MDH5303117.1 cyclopropane-fatty-acyl-phospholipid synthase family protein [Gammaproteobacteria bacterium]MDH5322161.1 cyclopropane-fatty-acyl-phospholipid synthase family protein [Gammaproteobacteria bacterium]
MGVDTRGTFRELSFNHRFVQWILWRAGNPRIAVRLWNGDEFRLTDSRPVACMELRERRAALELLRNPSVGFGEGFSAGRIEIHGDLLAFVNEITAAITNRNANRYYLPKIGSILHAMRTNSLSRSWHNVHHHYDLGNDFYRLWLDERMVYTCAYFDTATATLAEAQRAKLDHVCRKLRLRPGQKVIEAGCGWGALALHMAEHYGVQVVAYNNSHEQIAFARQKAVDMGLDGRVRFVEDDFRNIDGRCDAFVSIGMLEHVGLASFSTLGAIVKRCLKADGTGLIHSIGRSYPQKPDAWIVKHIFPGGHMPSLSEMMHVFEPHKLRVVDVENLRPHYARTCALWLQNFDAVADKVATMYGDEFVRMWRLYLAGSSAGFQSGTLQLYQILFAPPDSNNVPWTREYQYAGAGRNH